MNSFLLITLCIIREPIKRSLYSGLMMMFAIIMACLAVLKRRSLLASLFRMSLILSYIGCSCIDDCFREKKRYLRLLSVILDLLKRCCLGLSRVSDYHLLELLEKGCMSILLSPLCCKLLTSSWQLSVIFFHTYQ